MGGRDWRHQFFEGSPILDNLAQTVYPLDVDRKNPRARGILSQGALVRAKFGEKKPNKPSVKLREEAFTSAGKGQLERLFPFAGSGKLVANGKKDIANPAYRLERNRPTSLELSTI